MKKRMICSLLALAMVSSIALTGCNTVREAPPELTPEAQKELEEKQAAQSEQEEQTEVTTQDGEEVEGRGDYISDCPMLEFDIETSDVLDEDGNWIIEAYYPTIAAYNDFDDITAAAESIEASCNGYEHWVAECTDEINEMINGGDEILNNMEKSQDMPLTSATVDVYQSRVDSNVISILEYYYYFAGGAHPSYEYGACVIDSKTGKDLSISDLIDDMDGFETYALERAKQVAEDYGKAGDVQYYEDIDTAVANILDQKFYLDAAGIEFMYNPDEIAPYACGMLTFLMPYDEILSYINKEYLPNIEDGYMAMPLGEKCQSTVINGMMVSFDDENGIAGPGYITAGDTRKTVVEDGYIEEAYLYKRLEKIYVFANYYQNDRPFFSVFDVTDGDVREIYSVSDMKFDRNTLSQNFVTLTAGEEAEGDAEEVVNIDDIIHMD